MKGDISSYCSGKVQEKDHKVTVHDGNNGEFGSQYHCINRTVILFLIVFDFVDIPGQVMESCCC